MRGAGLFSASSVSNPGIGMITEVESALPVLRLSLLLLLDIVVLICMALVSGRPPSLVFTAVLFAITVLVLQRTTPT